MSGRKGHQCRVQGCHRKNIPSVQDLCHKHVVEYRNKALTQWHDAIALKGANCEDRYDEFAEVEGIAKPTPEQAKVLCHRCPVFKECKEVLDLKIFTDGVILAGEVIGTWQSI